jgi:hypothetical protein
MSLGDREAPGRPAGWQAGAPVGGSVLSPAGPLRHRGRGDLEGFPQLFEACDLAGAKEPLELLAGNPHAVLAVAVPQCARGNGERSQNALQCPGAIPAADGEPIPSSDAQTIRHARYNDEALPFVTAASKCFFRVLDRTPPEIRGLPGARHVASRGSRTEGGSRPSAGQAALSRDLHAVVDRSQPGHGSGRGLGARREAR